jgi:hypothetical protein
MASNHKPPGHTTCRECGAPFNMDQQPYYDYYCPSCMREKDPQRLARSCAECGDDVMPDDVLSVSIPEPPGSRRAGRRAHLPVCSEDCKQAIKERHRRRP